MRTLGDRVADADAARFVNRAPELRRLEELLGAGPRVVLVHGPGGVGKSALLREFARRAERRGRSVHWLEGREVGPAPDALADAVSDAAAAARPLIVIDTFERMEALGGYLRRSVLPALPEKALVVICGRRAPGPEWREQGWAELCVELKLEELEAAEASEVLSQHGIDSAAKARRILSWAGGSPLALTLAGQAAEQSPEWDGELETSDVVSAIVARLADPGLEPEHAQTLWVASIARVTTLELLRDALPEADPVAELRWLGVRTFAEPLGGGIALHELVASALRQELVAREPLRERELRRRICDHMYDRAHRGDLLQTIELAHLSQSQTIRWGFAWQPATRFRLADVRDGDAEKISRRLRGTWYEPLLAGTLQFIEEAPEHVTTVRDARDDLRGYTIALTPADAPAFCAADPLLGPRVEHARRLPAPATAILWRDAVDLGTEVDPAVISMIGMAGVLRAGHGNPHYAYLPINPRLPGAVEFSRALGGTRLDELEVSVGPVRIECHLVDYGPEGLLGAQRNLIYRELGLTPPPAGNGAADVTTVVREALRNLDRPYALAASELATGDTLQARAASVRELLDEALEEAFGATPAEQLTRQALILGYIDRAPSHELAAKQLSLSRAAYFRRLKRGIDQIAGYLAAKRGATR
jgi:hypothetical protein